MAVYDVLDVIFSERRKFKCPSQIIATKSYYEYGCALTCPMLFEENNKGELKRYCVLKLGLK